MSSPFDTDYKPQIAPTDAKTLRLLRAAQKSRTVCAETGAGWGTGRLQMEGTPDRQAPKWLKGRR